MNRFKTCRTNMNYTQKKMADFLGIDRTTYVKYESGTIAPPAETVSKLADYFGVTVDYLLGRTDDPSPRVEKSAPAPALSPDEAQLLAAFRALNAAGQQNAQTYLAFLAADPALSKDTASARMA